MAPFATFLPAHPMIQCEELEGPRESKHGRYCITLDLARRFLTAQSNAYMPMRSLHSGALVSKRRNELKAFSLWFQYLYLKLQWS